VDFHEVWGIRILLTKDELLGFELKPTSFILTRLLLDGNDTVSISMWRRVT